MEDRFAGLHIYYAPTDKDRQVMAQYTEGIERDYFEELTGRRRVGYVLGRSDNVIVYVLDDPHYSDDEYGQFKVLYESIPVFFDCLAMQNMELLLPKQTMVSRNALERCTRPSDGDDEENCK